MTSSVTQPVLYLKSYYVPEDIQKAVTSYLLGIPECDPEKHVMALDIFRPRPDPSVEGYFTRICLLMAMNAVADISYSPWINVRRSFLNLRTSFRLQARPLGEVNDINSFLMRVEGKLLHYTNEVISGKENKPRRNWLMSNGAKGASEVTLEEIDLWIIRGQLLLEWEQIIKKISGVLGGDFGIVNGYDSEETVCGEWEGDLPKKLEDPASENLKEPISEKLEDIVSEMAEDDAARKLIALISENLEESLSENVENLASEKLEEPASENLKQLIPWKP